MLAALTYMLVLDHGWFFRGDTQAAYYGWWYHLGSSLRDGVLPVMDVQTWRAGDLAAEGQWALFNPAVWVLGLLTTTFPSVIGLATAVKFAVACFGALGTFVLARSYGAHPALAYVAGLASSLGGMTVWLDLPSWVAGLTIWSLMPWAWWAIRRVALGAAGPFLALLFSYLVVTTGYVYGSIMLGVVLVGVAVEAVALLGRRRLLPLLGVALFSGLVAITVYLPGVLTLPATVRSGGSTYVSDGKLTTDPLQVLTSFLPASGAEEGFQQQTAWRYVAWFVPLLAFVAWRSVRESWREVSGPLVCLLGIFLIVNGPGVLGPLRWPMRLQPFLVQFAVVLAAVLLSRYRVFSWRRALVGVAWVALATAWFALRHSSVADQYLVSGALVLVACAAVAWLFVRLPATAALVAAVASFGVLALQLSWYPDAPSDQRHLPHSLDGYRTQLTTARGDVMVLGQQEDAPIFDPPIVSEVLDGSMWYLNPHPVQNTYTTISHRAYYDRYCIRIHGQTCADVLETLFSTEPTTGELRVDLLRISTLLLIKDDVGDPPVPDGWHVTTDTSRTVTWVRDGAPLPTAGGPVWSSPGTQVSLVDSSDREVELHVDQLPSSGGQVVLSRLDWPGYSTSVGSFTDPVDDYLLTLSLPASAAGSDVLVEFDPPGWKLELACLWVALIGGLAWTVIRQRQQKWIRWAQRRGWEDDERG